MPRVREGIGWRILNVLIVGTLLYAEYIQLNQGKQKGVAVGIGHIIAPITELLNILLGRI